VATEGDGVNGGEADNSGGTENTTPSGEPAGEALPDDAAAGVETEQIQTELVDEVVEAAGEGDVAEPDATATEPATDTPETNEDPAGSAEETDAAATGSTADGEEVEVDEVEIKDQFDLAAEREKLMKEYQRKLDGWKADRKKAEDKVKELNFRFADWYYVISEDEYKKIHLGRKELIKIDEEALKEKEEQEAAEGDDIDAFRELEQPLE